MICLQALFLRWCSQLRNFSIQHLCGMRHLRILSLAGNYYYCDNYDSYFITALEIHEKYVGFKSRRCTHKRHDVCVRDFAKSVVNERGKCFL